MADVWMDVDTALGEVPVNIMPLLDDTDFKSIEAAVVYNAAGLALFWNFVTTAGAQTCTAVTPTSGGDYDWTDQGTSGMYAIEMPASGGASANNDTEGFGWFTGVATGVLPWRGPVIGFRAAALNNSLIDAGTTGLLAPTTAARTLNVSAGGVADADMTAISTDSTAADRFETMLDGTGGNTLSLGNLAIVSASGAAATITGQGAGAGLIVTGGATGHGITVVGGGTSGDGIHVSATSGDGLDVAGGTAGLGVRVAGGATGIGMQITAAANDGLYIAGGGSGRGINVNCDSNSDAVALFGSGTGAGLYVEGGATGIGVDIHGGATSGDGVHISATDGDGIDAVGAGAGNVDIRADITGNLTGTVTDVVNGVAIETGGITALSFSAGAIDAAAIAANAIGASEIAANAITSTKIDTTAYGAIADAVADEAYDGSVTLRQSTRLANSANGAKLSGAATTTVAVRDLADSKDRVTATVDSDGNRSAVVLDLA